MTKRHLQHDKESEVNGQTMILQERLAHLETVLDQSRLRREELERERDNLRAQLAESLKTPDEWCRLLRINIADPDGWRSEGDPPWSQPLSYDDFMNRALRSTQLMQADPALLWSECKRLLAQLADAQADTERLEWLCRLIADRLEEESLLEVSFHLFGDAPCDECREAVCQHVRTLPHGMGEFRASIDGARSAGIGWTMASVFRTGEESDDGK